MKTEEILDILKLPTPARIELVFDIWDSITDLPDSVELTGAQKTELEKRFKSYEQNPDAGALWNEVKKRIQTN